MGDDSERFPSPFEVGSWVRTFDRTHPMSGKQGRVTDVEYVGQGLTDQFLITVQFEGVRIARSREWQFRHQELVVIPSAEVAAPFRKAVDL